MTREEYLEFIRQQPYDAFGDFSGFLDEKNDTSDNSALKVEPDETNRKTD